MLLVPCPGAVSARADMVADSILQEAQRIKS